MHLQQETLFIPVIRNFYGLHDRLVFCSMQRTFIQESLVIWALQGARHFSLSIDPVRSVTRHLISWALKCSQTIPLIDAEVLVGRTTETSVNQMLIAWSSWLLRMTLLCFFVNDIDSLIDLSNLINQSESHLVSFLNPSARPFRTKVTSFSHRFDGRLLPVGQDVKELFVLLTANCNTNLFFCFSLWQRSPVVHNDHQ